MRSRSRYITESDISYNNDKDEVNLKVEDGDHNKDEYGNLKVFDKDGDVTADKKVDYRPKKNKEVMNHYWDEFNS